METKGFRVYAPKTYLVIGSGGVTALTLPDCSQPYAVRFGSVLAKHDFTFDVTNGMVTKVESKQDTTTFPANLLTAVTEAAKADKQLTEGFSTKAAGAVKEFGILSVDCSADGGLKVTDALHGIELRKIAVLTGGVEEEPPAQAPKPVPKEPKEPPKGK
jgi:hypothetical protein